VPNEQPLHGGLKPSHRVLGDLSARQLLRDARDGTQPAPSYDLTRLYETLTKSSTSLPARSGPIVRRRAVALGIGSRLSHPLRKRPTQSLNLGVARQAIKYAPQVLIIAASFALGLNFERFPNYAAGVSDLYRLAIYHLSGQADADKRTREEEAHVQQERIRQEQEIQIQRAKHEQEVEAQRAKEEQASLARIERIRAMTTAWEEFLTDNRAKFKQIDLIKDQHHGDYNCLRIRNTLWDFVSPAKRSTEIARQKAEASTYQIRDAISDGFVEWLNADHVLDRGDWNYSDLQNIATDFSAGCLSPDQIWRANRYYEPSDITLVIMPSPI
jgi:hypothetical protein